ncbi:MAG: tetratricopeptide repeat protein [Pseudomonadota bacterium]
MKQLAAALIILAMSPLLSFASSARTLTERGNSFYAQGKYDDALKAYDEAGIEMPESPQIAFNKGNVYFQKGDLEKAKSAYESAALKAPDPIFEANAQYNMGNTSVAQGKKYLDSDLKKSLEEYEASIHHYKEALRLNPELQEAATNIETVRLLIKDLLDQIKKQEEEEKKKEQEQKQKQEQKPKENDQHQQSGSQDKPEEKGKEEEKNAEKQESKTQPENKQDETQKQEQGKEGQQQGEKQQQGKEQNKQANQEKGFEQAEEILKEEKANKTDRDIATQGGYQPVERDW